MSIVARPSLWPDIKGPCRREGWWREAMEAADSLINRRLRQRGAGLGSDSSLDSSDADLLLVLWYCATVCTPPPPQLNPCFPTKVRLIKQETPPVNSVDNVYFTECASCFISCTGWFLSLLFIFTPCDALLLPPFAFVSHQSVSLSVCVLACFMHIWTRCVVQWHAIYTESVFNFSIKITAKTSQLPTFIEKFLYWSRKHDIVLCWCLLT